MKDKYKILYLEDVPTDAELVNRELKESRINFDLLVIDSEIDYTKALTEFSPDIILSDHSLPGFSSFEALKILREKKINIPFIVITAAMTEELALSIVVEGAADYIMKDRLKRLPHAVINAIEKFRFEKERKQLIDEVYEKETLSNAALRESENRFRAIIEKSTEMITLSSRQGKMLYISPSVTQTFGYSLNDVSQASSFNFIHPEDIKKFAENREKILQANGQSYSSEIRLLHKNGNWIWCEVTLTNMLQEPGVKAIVSNFRDISGKKMAEQQQDFNVNNLNALINNTNDLLWSVDKDFNLITSNKPFDEMGIVNFGKTIPKGGNVLSVAYSPEMKEHFKKLYERAFAGEAFIRNDHFDYPVDLWTEISYNPILKGNAVIGTACHSRDITERKKSEETIIQSESRFREIFNSVPEALVIFDCITWKFINFNDNAIGMFKYPAEEFTKKGPVDISPLFQKDGRSSEEKAKEFTLNAMNGGKPIFEWLFLDANGKEILCEVRLTTLHNVSSQQLLCSFIDITEKKKTEAILIKRESQLTLASEMAKLGYWEMDISTGIFTFTDEFYTIFKTTAEKVGGYAMSAARYAELFIHPDDRGIVAASVAEAINSPDASFSFKAEHRIIYATGEAGYVSVHFYIVKDSQGRTLKNFGVNQDITERKLAEINLKELNEDLQSQTKELALSNAELEQFAYVASHDLQEPLRMVTSFLTLLEKKYGNVIDDKGKKYISFAVDGAKRMRQIILDLLEFSRVARIEDDEEELDLDELLNEIEILLRKKIEEKKAVIIIDKLPKIHAHRSPMRQVFQNLIGNALKYSNKDIPVQIHITAKELKGFWQFAVIDNGIGIEKEYFDKIFIIFQRLHNKDDYSGTGMGLAITKKIIETQGGKIWMESEVGKGSTFYFTIQKEIK